MHPSAIPLKKFTSAATPPSPGVYFFVGRQGKTLYIGKAANLRDRLRAYFAQTPTEKIRRLLTESLYLRLVPAGSEIEALIEEARWIKKIRPKYNVLLRDDKNYFYIVFTKETFPRISITHQPRSAKFRNVEMSSVLGPFVSGRALKSTLRLLRRIFPYCTCRKPHYRTCLSEQLGLDPGYCCQKGQPYSRQDIERYRSDIGRVKKVLAGKSKTLIKELGRKLERLSAKRQFEEAARVRDQIRGLERIFAHRGLISTAELKEFEETPSPLRELPARIECYDASVLSGQEAVGAMTVFAYGEKSTKDWRLFRIRRNPDDPASIREMLARRIRHREWPLPDLIVIDGGKAQLGAARTILKKNGLSIPTVSIAKGKVRGRYERLLWGEPVRMQSMRSVSQDVRKLLVRMRDATHRFALSYHRDRRKKRMFSDD